MFTRKENADGSLDGICGACAAIETIEFREELILNTIYKIGICNNCDYEHIIPFKKL
jgi:hypothetical protein